MIPDLLAAKAEPALASAAPTPGPVRWSYAGIAFELRSSDPAVRESAGSVFARWQTDRPAGVVLSWQVDPAPDGSWPVRDAATGHEVSRARSAAMAVAHVEGHCMNVLLGDPGVPPSLHACVAVRPDGAAVACVGRCGSGKSTLALALWHHAGWSLPGDDVLLIDPEPGWVLPVPRRVSARHASREWVGEACWRRIEQAPNALPTQEGFLFTPTDDTRPPDRVRLRALFLLQRLDGTAGPARAVRVDPVGALLALAPYGSARDRGGPGAAFRAVAPLVDAVPVYELGRGAPAEMIRTIDALLA